MFGRNKLRKAIEAGLAAGRLSEHLRPYFGSPLTSKRDAQAIVGGLERLDDSKRTPEEQSRAAYALARLFQTVGGTECAAFGTLRDAGIPALIRTYDRLEEADEQDEDALMFILKVLAAYGTRGGAERVVAAARLPRLQEAHMWSVVLRHFEGRHPQRRFVLAALSSPLPSGFAAVALLDLANASRLAGDEFAHPFDTPDGHERLEAWLRSEDPSRDSHAHSAAAALPFVEESVRPELLKAALAHRDVNVRMEAAWAAAKVGIEAGAERLTHYARDYRHARVAVQYLEELGMAELVPVESRDPEFQASSEFAGWLAHPNELGRTPDELEVVDQRELAWPPTGKTSRFYLIKYRAAAESPLDEDDVGCGLVGSVTFCLFSYELAQRPPEDGYAIHCYWELESDGLVREVELSEGTLRELLAEWPGPAVDGVELVRAASIDPTLGHPRSTVALVSGIGPGDEEGYLVLDGATSRWYPASHMPPDAPADVVLMLHVGRALLGFSSEPDRRAYLRPQSAAKSSDQIIAGYEQLLEDARNLSEERREEAFESFGPLGNHFDAYIEALTKAGRLERLRPVIEQLEPYWDHNRGYGDLGRAAHACGATDLAERLFLELRENYADHHRSQKMGLLAEIQCGAGRAEEARELLLECLGKVRDEAREAGGSDKKLFESWFQGHRAKFTQLFPEQAEQALASRGIPVSTLGDPSAAAD